MNVERPTHRPRDGRGAEPRRVAGVRLSPTGRSFDYDCDDDIRLFVGDKVVVDDRRMGVSIGVVSVASARRDVRVIGGRVLRKANAADLERQARDLERERQALAHARACVQKQKLPIKIFRVDLTTDRALFVFSSEQRVDFRELVRDLAAFVHTRVELRQVGARDEAKQVGGIGSCGQQLCCSTFLQRFAPVSIRSAKNQNLALTPSKVTGQCGRLKCCLVYEEAQYVEAARGLPKVGKKLVTPDGEGRVEDVDLLRGRVRVSFVDKPPQIYSADDARRFRAAQIGAMTGGEPITGLDIDDDEAQ